MQKLCDIADLPRFVAGVVCAVEQVIEQQTFIVVRLGSTDDEDVRVYLNQCPHLGVALNWQPDRFLDSSEEFLICSTHGALFLPNNGYCVQGPCAGKHLKAVPFVVKDAALYLQHADAS